MADPACVARLVEEIQIVSPKIVVVMGPAAQTPGSDTQAAVEALRRLVDAGAKPRPAASVVADLTGLSANALYQGLTQGQRSTK
jgi:16S rRNA (cytidine1402-2'-O)-methyltransferase